jgi:hypothetical protein
MSCLTVLNIKKKTVGLRCEVDLLRRISSLAQSENRTTSGMLSVLVGEAMAARGFRGALKKQSTDARTLNTSEARAARKAVNDIRGG